MMNTTTLDHDEDVCQFKMAGIRKWPDIDCWKKLLESEWLPMVIVPMEFRTHHEDDLSATRTFGYDAEGRQCYYAHRFAISSLYSDDDDLYYESPAYRERVESWRLTDGRWLVYRLTDKGGCSSSDGFALADCCPL